MLRDTVIEMISIVSGIADFCNIFRMSFYTTYFTFWRIYIKIEWDSDEVAPTLNLISRYMDRKEEDLSKLDYYSLIDLHKVGNYFVGLKEYSFKILYKIDMYEIELLIGLITVGWLYQSWLDEYFLCHLFNHGEDSGYFAFLFKPNLHKLYVAFDWILVTLSWTCISLSLSLRVCVLGK